MPYIRPISDFRNKFSEISRTAHETREPVYLTKNGYGDMVVMSMEAYEQKLYESEIYFKLREAELEAKTTDKRYLHEEILSDLRERINKSNDDEHNV